MTRLAALAVLCAALGGCIATLPNGQITSITVPPGCKAQWMISASPIANFSASGTCDETSQPAPASGAKIELK